MSTPRRKLPNLSQEVMNNIFLTAGVAGNIDKGTRERTKAKRNENTYKTYKGNMKNGLPHGKGIMKIKGGVYTGNWKNGVPHGKGTRESESFIMNGNWKDGKMNGQGQAIKKNTHAQSGYVQYNGNWKNGKMHGTGNYQILLSGAFYSGQFKNGKWNGKGMGRKSNRHPIHDGNWKNGEPA